MAKQKKIGFKYFLNKRMKAKDFLVDAYPLYVQITFNATNTKMQPYTRDTLYWTEKMLKDFLAGKSDGHSHTENHYRMVREAQDLIESVIRYEHQKNADFGVNYLGRLNAIYQEKVTNILVPMLAQELKVALAEFMVAKNYLRVLEYEDEHTLEDMINTLFNYFDYERLSHLLPERIFELLEAYAAYLEFADSLPYSEFVASVYNWVIGNDRGEMVDFIADLKLANCKKRITRDFFPKKSKVSNYVQVIEGELLKAIVIARR